MAGGFLIEIARDESLPLAVRRQAVVIARHFLTIHADRTIGTSLKPALASASLS